MKDGRNQGKVVEDPIIVEEACQTDKHDAGKLKHKGTVDHGADPSGTKDLSYLAQQNKFEALNIIGNVLVVEEDPLLSDMIRSKEMGVTTQVVDVINLVAETDIGTLLVQLVQVGDSLAHDYQMTEEHNMDQHFPDIRITDHWCDVVTDLDYCQDSTNSDLEQEFGSDRRQLALVAPPIPAVVQRDMDFLRQSWDNMAEVDVDQQFQMVVSKKKKKNQKQQA